MNLRRTFVLATATALSLAACTPAGYGQQSVASASSPTVEAEEPKAKNVILFIGDGMGISTVTAGRIYAGQKRGQTGEELIGSSGLFLASLTSVRFACSLGPGTAAGILLGLLPHRSGAQQPARPKKC